MRNLLFGLSLLFILYSCKDNTTTPSTSSTSEYYPLSVGNEWIYSFFYKDSSREDGINTFTINQTKKIIGTKNIDGKNYFTVETTLWLETIPDELKDTTYTRNDNGKIYIIDTSSAKEYLYSDLSLPVGGTFILAPEHYEPAMFKLIDKNAKLILPTLAFDYCMFFENLDNSQSDSTHYSKVVMYYVPGVGLAKTESKYEIFYKETDNCSTHILIELKYAKIGNKEYGKK